MKKLYVGNLPFATTESDVRDFFAPIELNRVSICLDKESGRPKGFAFVEVRIDAEASQAISDLHQQEMNGRRIVVNEAIEKPKAERNSVPRSDARQSPRPDARREPEHDKGKQKKGGSPRRTSSYEDY